MDAFMISLLDLAFFPFRHTDNVILFVPVFAVFWCAGWAVFKSLFHHFKL